MMRDATKCGALRFPPSSLFIFSLSFFRFLPRAIAPRAIALQIYMTTRTDRTAEPPQKPAEVKRKPRGIPSAYHRQIPLRTTHCAPASFAVSVSLALGGRRRAKSAGEGIRTVSPANFFISLIFFRTALLLGIGLITTDQYWYRRKIPPDLY